MQRHHLLQKRSADNEVHGSAKKARCNEEDEANQERRPPYNNPEVVARSEDEHDTETAATLSKDGRGEDARAGVGAGGEATAAAASPPARRSSPPPKRDPRTQSLESVLAELNGGESVERAQFTFPERLMELLEKGVAKSAMWFLEGEDSFCIMPKPFQKQVLDKYFQGTKFESFTRKLNRWGFKRVAGQRVPPNAVAYFHHFFRRGHPELIKKMSGGKRGKEQETLMQNQLRMASHNNPSAVSASMLAAAGGCMGPATGGGGGGGTGCGGLPVMNPFMAHHHHHHPQLEHCGGPGIPPSARGMMPPMPEMSVSANMSSQELLLQSLLISQQADMLALASQRKQQEEASELESRLRHGTLDPSELDQAPPPQQLPPTFAMNGSSSGPSAPSSAPSVAPTSPILNGSGATDAQLLQFLLNNQKQN